MIKKTLSFGLTHFIAKNGYQSEAYQRKGESIKFLVEDRSGFSVNYQIKYEADIKVLNKNQWFKLIQVVLALVVYKPDAIEWYQTNPVTKLQLLYPLIFKLSGCKLFYILRGKEFVRRGFKKSWFNKMSIAFADAVIAKEYNLLKGAVQFDCSEKLHFLHNCVPLKPSKDRLPFTDREIDVLFLNAPRKERHVLFLIDVFDKLLRKYPFLKIVMIGFDVIDQNDHKIQSDYQKEILAKISNMGLNSKIKIRGFCTEGDNFFKRSRVFVFPADIVFCNYALLEAMSWGCVPVVSDGEGAHSIVNNEVNGLVSRINEEEFCRSIEKALNPENWEKYSRGAVKTIEEEFSIDSWYEKIKEIRNGKN